MRTRVVVATLLSSLWASPAAAQAPAAQGQPGLKWTDEQIQKTAHHVRAGRRLTPKTWPNGARVAVCLSIDPDNFSIALNAGNTNPVPISLGEYGALEGVPRMLKLLDKHGVPASFYIPAVAAMLHPGMIQQIRKRPRHEVAIHGWIHENPMTLDDPVDEWRMISQSLDLLEKQWGRRPVGNRNPSWTMSTHTIGLLKKAGLLYDSSLQAMDEPHEVLLDGQPTGLIELPVNWIIDDSPMYGAAGDFPSPRTDHERVPGRFRRGLQGRHDVHADDASAHHGAAVAHPSARGAHRLHEVEAGRVVRDRGRDCEVHQAAGGIDRHRQPALTTGAHHANDRSRARRDCPSCGWREALPSNPSSPLRGARTTSRDGNGRNSSSGRTPATSAPAGRSIRRRGRTAPALPSPSPST